MGSFQEVMIFGSWAVLTLPKIITCIPLLEYCYPIMEPIAIKEKRTGNNQSVLPILREENTT